MQDETSKALLQEMQWIRKLIMLQTLTVGYKQKDLALAMGVSAATLSRMLPKGFSKISTAGKGGNLPGAEI